MSLKGIDIASYQATMDVTKVKADFVIVKATEATGYVNPYCNKHIAQALKSGKRIGLYHFARNGQNSAKAEANFFVKNIRGYIKKAVLVLDWEDGGNVWNVAWAKQWLDEVYRQTGVKPLIYMSESVVNSHNWSSVVKADYGLWVARYRDMTADYNYNMNSAGAKPSVKYWPGYAMWQWTSSGRLNGYGGDVDCNVFYGNGAAWDKYAGGKASASTARPKPAAKPKPTAKPAPAGRTYRVNKGDTLSGIGAKVGVAWPTIAALNGLRSPYIIYPGQVLKLGGSAPKKSAAKYYTVRRGDTLSGIANVYGTSWQNLQRLNKLPNANMIFAGQRLRVK